MANDDMPLTIMVNGQQYDFVPRNSAAEVTPYHAPQRVINYNGQPHVVTPTGIAPYSPVVTSSAPAWTQNPYHRASGFLAVAAGIGLILVCMAIAFYALVVVVIAHAAVIGMCLVALFVGGLMFLRALTTARHGHYPRR
jgi:hypothetical protein